MTGQQTHIATAQQSYTFASRTTCPDPSGSPSTDHPDSYRDTKELPPLPRS